MPSRKEVNDLFSYAMKGQWEEVLIIYKKSQEAQKAKITILEDTVLHIAISVGQTETAVELVRVSKNSILEVENARGNTALHIAAALGNLVVCTNMIKKNPNLIAIRNHNGETPVFLAALNGKKDTFLYLYSKDKEESLVRRNNGDTILHAAISGEYFSLAMCIMNSHHDLADAINENGLTPLHILASKPNAFHSSTRLGLFDRIIYHSLVVDELKEESHDVEAYIAKKTKRRIESLNYPENYKACINFFGLVLLVFQVLFDKLLMKKWIFSLCGLYHKSDSQVNKERKKGDEENQDEVTPSICTPVMSSESKISTEQSSLENSSSSSSSSSHGDTLQPQRDENGHFPPNYDKIVLFVKLLMKSLLIILGIGIWRIKKIQRKKELHMWARCAMNELVKHTTSYKFYDNTGLDPHKKTHDHGEEESLIPNIDPNSIVSDSKKKFTTYPTLKSSQKIKLNHNKTVGKQHTPILIAAKMGVSEMIEKILEEFPVAIQDVDSDNKNVVLLAVENRQSHVYNLLLHSNILKESVFRQLDKDGNSALHLAAECKEQRPWLIPGVALQMQWEIKWYKETGIPIFRGVFAFDAFSISSLLALCFSITALVFFLSILTSRYDEKDFAMDLPRKLLFGLTSLFASIASMLVSFCDGHIFILTHKLRYVAFPLYAALCFPITYFAFAQLSLYFDLIWAIFKKVPQRSNKAFLH
uniref:PGG domain-containing protein n=1 Tax=Cannabis sativa TaxID=3483 RepID=A0A803Q241_CANSA